MKHLFFVSLLMLLFASCGKKDSQYYELVGGDPNIDYLEFVGDSAVRFVSPSLLPIECPYTQQGDDYDVRILGLSHGYLHRLDADHLQGQPPFFEGVWERRK